MQAPTFVAEYPTAFNTSSSPKTAMNAIAVTAGDLLVAFAAMESTGTLGITENGTSSWVLRQSLSLSNYCAVSVWTYLVAADETLTVTFTGSGGMFGGNVLRFSGHGGIGVSNIANASSGNPALTLSGVADKSALVMISADWNAVTGTQTADATIGAFTAKTGYPGNGANYGVLDGYYADAGLAGSKTIGQTAPTGLKWVIAGIEVKGVPSELSLACDSGSFSVTGSDVTLTESGASEISLACDSGNFAITGMTAGLIASASAAITITCAAGSFEITGSDVELIAGFSYTFPTLSTSPLVEPWEESAANDPTLRSQKEGGYDQTRAQFTGIPWGYHIQYGDLSQADKDTLKAFEISMQIGVGKFTHPDIGLANIRLTGPIQYAYSEAYGLWTASFDVEEV